MYSAKTKHTFQCPTIGGISLILMWTGLMLMLLTIQKKASLLKKLHKWMKLASDPFV